MSYIEIGILISLIIVVLFCCFGNNKILVDGFAESFVEGFTNDEALQNVASIYNTGNMSVTNANITTSLTAQTATIKGDLKVVGTSNLSGSVNANDIKSNTGNIQIFSAGNAYAKSLNVNGATIMDGNLNVNGIFTPKGEQVIVIYLNQTTQPNQWGNPIFTKIMVPYFKKSMPDGTLLKFIFVYAAGALRAVNTNYWVAYFSGIKIGNQIICHEMSPRQEGIGDIYNSTTSSDSNWRAVITNP